MKRALTMVAVLLALAAVTVFTQRRAGVLGGRMPVSRAAEMLPAETAIFFSIPDLDQTLGRWRKSEFAAITQEPSWQQEAKWEKYLALAGQRMADSVGHQLYFTMLAELRRVDASGIFVAATNFDAPQPRLITGLTYRGKKSEVEAAVRVLKEKLLKAWPGAKSELSSAQGVEIESITSAAPSDFRTSSRTSAVSTISDSTPTTSAIHIAFRDDWLFVATDRVLLAGTLNRYLRVADAGKTLAEDPAFLECRKQALPEADLSAWARWSPEARKRALGWLPRTLPGGDSELQAAQYECRIDGPVVDRLYLHFASPRRPYAPVQRSLAFVSPDALGFAAINFDGLRGEMEWLLSETWGPIKGGKPGTARTWKKLSLDDHPGTLNEALALKKLTLDDLWAAFGPELTMVIFDRREFHAGSYPVAPDFVAALEVRDAVKARKFAEIIAEVEFAAPATEENGETLWTWTPSREQHWIRPPLLLTKTHLLFGSSLTRVMEAAGRARRGGPTLESNPNYAKAVQGLDAANGAFCFVDAKRLFACGMFDMPFLSAGVETWFVPIAPDETIGRHLRPGTICARTAGQGWVVESNLDAIGIKMVNEALRKRVR